MRTIEDSIRSQDGTVNLFLRAWLPGEDSDLRAVVGLAHGLGEHSGRYDHVARQLVNSGCVVYALDHRGCGRSEGVRGAAPSFGAFLDDFGLMLSRTRSDHGEIPLFLYGHSMGSIIVLSYALHRPDGISGLIASTPAFTDRADFNPMIRLLVSLLAALSPDLTARARFDFSRISRDPAVYASLQADHLSHQRISWRLLRDIFDRTDELYARGAELTMPMLLLHGSSDALIDVEVSRHFKRVLGDANCQYIEYEDGYHELHNDVNKEEVFADIRAWLDQQVEARTA